MSPDQGMGILEACGHSSHVPVNHGGVPVRVQPCVTVRHVKRQRAGKEDLRVRKPHGGTLRNPLELGLGTGWLSQ